jgi:putative hydrolase of the HAD superfamily
MIKGIRNLLFDLGGVLIDVDYDRPVKAFEQLGVTDFSALYSQKNANDFFEKLETGHVTPEMFYVEMGKQCRPGTSRQQIKDAWVSILSDLRMPSIDYLEHLRRDYNLYLLSNTNAIHFEAIESNFQMETHCESIHQLFIKAYFSHQIGHRKPNEEAYRFVLEDSGILAEETLFIDDSPANMLPAQELGFKTHLLMHEEKIESLSIWN